MGESFKGSRADNVLLLEGLLMSYVFLYFTKRRKVGEKGCGWVVGGGGAAEVLRIL